ncbi:hypothetical protein Bbelb_216740 [Branchiostoma belcheri]|nr:hypothetical protein Bbelb_216740 [Branchiostoma belcheri]
MNCTRKYRYGWNLPYVFTKRNEERLTLVEHTTHPPWRSHYSITSYAGMAGSGPNLDNDEPGTEITSTGTALYFFSVFGNVVDCCSAWGRLPDAVFFALATFMYVMERLPIVSVNTRSLIASMTATTVPEREEETHEAREERRASDLARKKIKRAQETPEASSERRATDQARKKIKRAQETPEVSSERRASDQARKKIKRAQETPEVSSERRASDLARKKIKKAHETHEASQERRASDLARKKRKRSHETHEATEQRQNHAVDEAGNSSSTEADHDQRQELEDEEDAVAFDRESKIRGIPYDSILQDEDLANCYSVAPGENEQPCPFFMDEDFEWKEKCKWLRCNPVTAARQFQHRLDVFFKDFIKGKGQPLGQVQNYMIRIEFQQRGSPHAHTILWIKDAPRIDVDSDADVIRFIDKYQTCAIPGENDSELRDLVLSLQKHAHSSSCRRQQLCRFHFPHVPSNNTLIARQSDEISPEVAGTFLKEKEEVLRRVRTVLDSHDVPDDVSLRTLLDKANVTPQLYEKVLKVTQSGKKVILQRQPSERFHKEKVEGEEKYRQLLMLYFPWEQEDIDLKANFQSFKEHYDFVKNTIHQNEAMFSINSVNVDKACDDMQHMGPVADVWNEVAPNVEFLQAEQEREGIIRERDFPDEDQLDNIDLSPDYNISGTSNTDTRFGGISILAVGDLFQLQPVGQSHVFSPPSDRYARLRGSLWEENFKMMELTQTMRQKDDQDFAQLLNRIRTGNVTKDDITVLDARVITKEDKCYPKDALHVFKTNKEVDEHNSLHIQTLGNRISDPHRGRRAGSGWDACSELPDDLVTLKVRLDYASPPGAALVRQLKTAARNGRALAFGSEPRVPEFQSCHATDPVRLEKPLRPIQGDHLANAVDRDRRELCPLNVQPAHDDHTIFDPLRVAITETDGLTLHHRRSGRYPVESLPDLDFADDIGLLEDTIQLAQDLLYTESNRM